MNRPDGVSVVELKSTVDALIGQVQHLSQQVEDLKAQVYRLECDNLKIQCVIDPESCPDGDDDRG